MGVNNLWQLLLPVGRRVNVESLERKTLAIDVSIWLTQFIKAMRDDEGKVVKNAHLIGTFRRIVKLLYYRIKPVFVFDGGAPALKKRTLISRRRRREDQETSLRKTAQRLLLAQLRKYHLQQGKGKGGKELTAAELEEALAAGREGGEEGATAAGKGKKKGGRRKKGEREEEQPRGFVAGFDPGEQQTQRSPASSSTAAATAAAVGGVVVLSEGGESSSVAAMEEEQPPSGSAARSGRRDPAAAFAQVLVDNEDDDEVEWEVDEEEAAEDILLESEEVDVGVLGALPPELQKDVVESAKRRQRMQSRQDYMPVAGNPALYSQAQISNFLKASKLNQKVMSLKDVVGEGGAKAEEGARGGERIASDGSRKFVIIKDREEKGNNKAAKPKPKSTQPPAVPAWNDEARGRKWWEEEPEEAQGRGGVKRGAVVEEEAVDAALVAEQREIARAMGLVGVDDGEGVERGGFLLEGDDGAVDMGGGGFILEEGDQGAAAAAVSDGGFLPEEDDQAAGMDGGGFLPEEDEQGAAPASASASASASAASAEAKPFSALGWGVGVAESKASSRHKAHAAEATAAAAPLQSASSSATAKARERGGGGGRDDVVEVIEVEGGAAGMTGGRRLPSEQEEEDRALALAMKMSLEEASSEGKGKGKGQVVVELLDDEEDEEQHEAQAKGQQQLQEAEAEAEDGDGDGDGDGEGIVISLGGDEDGAAAGGGGEADLGDFLAALAPDGRARRGDVTPGGDKGSRGRAAGGGSSGGGTGGGSKGKKKQPTAGAAPSSKNPPQQDTSSKMVVPADEAFENAIATASRLTTWAGAAVRRAIQQHVSAHPAAGGVGGAAAKGKKEEEGEDEEDWRVPGHPPLPVLRVEGEEDEEDEDVEWEAEEEEPEVAAPVQPKKEAASPAEPEQRRPRQQQSTAAAALEVEVEEEGEEEFDDRPITTKAEPKPSPPPSASPAADDAAATNVEIVELVEDEDGQVADVEVWEGATAGGAATALEAAAVASGGGEEARRASAAAAAAARVMGQDHPEEEEDLLEGLEDEEALRAQMRREMRDAEAVTQEMREELMELLDLFGVPYLVAPMEAEAQCAALEVLGLVDGVVSDDSDAFLFGARAVYKNMFDERKYVEAFMAGDIERELGLRRVDLVALALLLGSDYTEGVRGVGIVNATEVVRAFPSPGDEEPPEMGLERFKRWLDGFDPLGELTGGGEGGKREEWVDERVEAFHKKHRSARTRWVVNDRFPDPAVFKAYLHPQVNGATDPFTWQLPDLDRIRVFVGRKLGWPVGDTDSHLLPMLKRMQERSVQTRLDSYYRAYEDNVTFAKIKSKRLRAAVAQLTGQAEAALGNAVQEEEDEGGEGSEKGKDKDKDKDKGKGKGKAGGEKRKRVQRKGRGKSAAADGESSSSDDDSGSQGGAAAAAAATQEEEEEGGSSSSSKRPRRATARRRKVVVDDEEEDEEGMSE